MTLSLGGYTLAGKMERVKGFLSQARKSITDIKIADKEKREKWKSFFQEKISPLLDDNHKKFIEREDIKSLIELAEEIKSEIETRSGVLNTNITFKENSGNSIEYHAKGELVGSTQLSDDFIKNTYENGKISEIPPEMEIVYKNSSAYFEISVRKEGIKTNINNEPDFLTGYYHIKFEFGREIGLGGVYPHHSSSPDISFLTENIVDVIPEIAAMVVKHKIIEKEEWGVIDHSDEPRELN